MTRKPYRDGQIRSAGAIMVAGAIGCLATLFHDPAATLAMIAPLRALLAAVAYLGLGWGGTLIVLGSRIHDRIAVPRRLIYMAPRERPDAGRPAWAGQDSADQVAVRRAA